MDNKDNDSAIKALQMYYDKNEVVETIIAFGGVDYNIEYSPADMEATLEALREEEHRNNSSWSNRIRSSSDNKSY